MKEITVLNRISKLVENIDYRTLYIEIKTNDDKYIIEKEKPRTIGFSAKKEGDINGKKGKKNKIQ